ncbi:MAG: response regulator [Moorellales bacterium]
MGKLRLLLADDQVLFRRGLRLFLEGCPDLEVVAEAGDGWEAVEKTARFRPDIVLMDLFMPRVGGIEATRMIAERYPETRVIILTVSEAEEDLFAAVRNGAQGYILKTVEPEQLTEMLRSAGRGEVPLSPALTRKLLQGCTRRMDSSARYRLLEGLTPRERQVLAYVAQGATNKEVARRLFISENTVKNHLRNIMEKLQVKNRAQAVALAVEHGLIGPDTKLD